MTYFNSISLSTLSLASILLLTACGGGSGGSSSAGGTTTPVTPVADTAAPSVGFSPTALTVSTGASATSTLTATDSRGVTSGPSVSCTNGGDFDVATNTFTAASVTSNTTSICTATAGDAAGNSGVATLTVTMVAPPSDTSSPVLTFSPAILTVATGSTAMATFAVFDTGGVSATPTASCTNGGSYNVTTGEFTPAVVTENTTSVCTLSVDDDAGNTGTGTLTVSMIPAPAATEKTLSGTLTYDRVPSNTATNGLNYNGTVQLPIRQVPVDLLNAAGAVLESTTSDENGEYFFFVDPGENVRVQVRAEIQRAVPNEIYFQILDNTSAGALYALQSELSVMPNSNQVRDLNADSGWDGSSYTETRAAAPFALLDSVYGAIEDFIAVDGEVNFPAFRVFWSTINRPDDEGTRAEGAIGTSSYTRIGGVPSLFILGDANNDTDEYDDHVIVHEFGHYFEDQLSRSDSTGGSHSSSERLDARLAFGEGWGNALSGMILDDPIYRDSLGPSQSDGFNINVESNSYVSTGWYSEGSIQSILYDLYDSDNDGADVISAGLGPIYRAFTDPTYKDTEAFTSIFPFLEALGNQSSVFASEVRPLTDAQLISGMGQFGVGETNAGGLSDALPVYLPLPTDGTPIDFCSRDNFGVFNKHGNRRFFEFDIAAAGDYRFRISRTSGTTNSDPDFLIYKNGEFVTAGESAVVGSEDQTFPLTAGQHVMEAYDFNNLDQPDSAAPGDTCFTMRLDAL